MVGVFGLCRWNPRGVVGRFYLGIGELFTRTDVEPVVESHRIIKVSEFRTHTDRRMTTYPTVSQPY